MPDVGVSLHTATGTLREEISERKPLVVTISPITCHEVKFLFSVAFPDLVFRNSELHKS